ncbi:hypothetical protein [Actinoplanes sp. NPDC026619]|uniref:hypothetical protein n=1 Tax=Actinoplanes sp. NPDC026619 TaxID=3155798 RepID=UPI0033DEA1BC
MVTERLRRVLLRSLPYLLAVLLTLVAAPPQSAVAPRAVAGVPAVATSPAEPADSPVVEPAGAEPAPADHAPALLAQFTAGVRGSRAPPAASV